MNEARYYQNLGLLISQLVEFNTTSIRTYAQTRHMVGRKALRPYRWRFKGKESVSPVYKSGKEEQTLIKNFSRVV